MEESTQDITQKLILNLNDMVRVYRALLEVVRKEKDILVGAQLDDLNENNRSKEAMLIKVGSLENQRVKFVNQIAINEKMDDPTLLKLSIHLGGSIGDELRKLHSVLVLMINRVQEINRQNENLVRSALQTVTGAMNAVKNGLAEKSTYKRGGTIDGEIHEAGHLVRREI